MGFWARYLRRFNPGCEKPKFHLPDTTSCAIEFFEKQFQRQVRDQDFLLNPFEREALDYIRGNVLDLGCGLGNFSLEAARRGCSVTAIDASPTAVERIRQAAKAAGLDVSAECVNLERWHIDRHYDTIVAIGLLMFFRREYALAILEDIRHGVVAGGRVAINVLVEGTNYMAMFDHGNYCLFGRNELAEHFADWQILSSHPDSFEAPGGTRKEFHTLIAESPAL